MKPAPFKFCEPRSSEELLSLLREFGGDCRILAGGQSLVPLMNMRMVQPRVLVSINKCHDLNYLKIERGQLACGAVVRQRDIEVSQEVREACPLLSEAAPHIGGLANRNRGTVCGSLAHADPLAELPAVALALEAEMIINGVQGRRVVAACNFFVSELTTCLEQGEMLEEVRLPVAPKNSRVAFAEAGNKRHGFAIAGVGGQLSLDQSGKCVDARLACIGGGPTPRRLLRAEKVIRGQVVSEALLREVEEQASEDVDPPEDFHADAAYRRQLIGVLSRRVVGKAYWQERTAQ